MKIRYEGAKANKDKPRRYVLKKDGHIRAERATYNECLKVLHDLSPFSWDYSMKHEGWTIEIDTREGK